MAEITREHLELAALAAGIFWDSDARAGIDPDKPAMHFDDGIGDTGKGVWWEPHLDDGDAFRLLAALKMSLRRTGDGWEASIPYLLPAAFCVPCDLTAAAAREAVVMCAAAVGERMKGGA